MNKPKVQSPMKENIKIINLSPIESI